MADMNGSMSNAQAQSFSLASDSGIAGANTPRVEAPLPGVMRGGADRYLANIYAVQKNAQTPPRPFYAGGNQTVNM